MSIFVLVVTLVWGIGHLQLGRALTRGRFLTAHRALRRTTWALLAMLALLPPAVMIASRNAPESVGVGLALTAWTAFGFSAVAMMLALPLGVANLVARSWARLRHRARLSTEFDAPRREFFEDLARAGVVTTSAGLTGVGFALATRVPPVRDVEITVDGLPPQLDGFHIVQLTDIHIGPTIRGEWLRAVVARANELAPDIVAVTGDVVDGFVDTLRDQVSPLGALRGRIGQYYVTGNHEYYWDAPGWVDTFESLGLKHLKNEHVVVERDGAKLVIGGVTDHRSGVRIAGHASDPHAAIVGAPENATRILLAHQPRSAGAAADAGWDVQLSGHTHGGQFFPFSTVIRLFQPYGHGLHLHAERMWIYVSRGTGYWGPPNRAGSSSEITSIRLRAGKPRRA